MQKVMYFTACLIAYIAFYLYGMEKVENGVEYEVEYRKKITAPDMGVKGKKDLNTASQYDIKLIKNFDKKMSDMIIDYRDENGDFKGMEDLVDIPGIGEKRYEMLRKEFSL